MPGQTIGTVNVQMGASQQTVRTLSYGATTLKALSDVSMANAQDRDVVTYVAATNSFVIAPAENSRLIIDNGFF
jgi:hypothetical protein